MSCILRIVMTILTSTVLSLSSYTTEVVDPGNEFVPEISELESIDFEFSQMIYECYGISEFNIYDVDDLDYETLTTRNDRGEIIVERMIGVVLDEEFNGEVLNTSTEFNYISYRNLGFAVYPGDYIVTYSLYNTENNIEDDFERYDYPINKLP